MRNDEANSADPPVERDDFAAELRRRGEEIAARIEQLRDRRRESATRYPHGSTADELAKAQAYALRIRQCAQRAHREAASADRAGASVDMQVARDEKGS